ncbi:MAG: F0F1 ATP synthase subunit delta [Patescibacteria group bacterium]
MKHRAEYYAKAFAALVAEAKSDKERETLIKNLAALLQKNGDASSAPKVVILAERFIRKSLGGREWIVETARALPESEKKLLRALAGSKDVVREVMNPALVAGTRITIDETEELDASLRRKLDLMFEKQLVTSD